MWLIVFMTGCSLPLLVLACICIWRQKQWEKQNEQETT